MLMMMMTALMLGLFSSPHCFGMCGGLLSALSSKWADKGPWALFVAVFKYNLGRVITYSLLGALVGAVGTGVIAFMPGAGDFFRLLGGTLLVLSGLYISQWWMGLRHLEKGLFSLWSKLAAKLNRQALLTGMAWGCLPCGLVFSALGMAMSQQSVWHGAAFMLAFGCGTLPVLLLTGMASGSVTGWLRQTLVNSWVKGGAGVALMGYGLWTIWPVVAMSGHH